MISFSCKKERDIDVPIDYVRVRGDDSWGFNDSKGNSVIPLGKYSFLNPIDEYKMIHATKGGKKGYIDIRQNEIVPIIYDELDLYSEGLAAAKIRGKYGFLDRKGKEIIAFQYDEVESFNSLGLALVKNKSKYGLIDKKGVTIIPNDFENIIFLESVKLIAVCKNGKWAFYSILGKPISDLIYDEINFTESSLVLVKKDGKVGYVDADLEIRIPFGKYRSGSIFNKNGLAIVSTKSLYGVINLKDLQVIKIKFDSIGFLQEQYSESDSYVGFKKNSLSLFDEKGNLLIDCIKDYFKDYAKFDGKIRAIYQVRGVNGLWGVVDSKGKVLIPLVYQEIERFGGENKTVVKLNGKYGLIDSKNKIILPLDNEYIESYKEQQYYVIKTKDKVGIVNYNLQIIFNFIYQDISPCTYDHVNRFIAKYNNKYGVIDRLGKIIIPFVYNEMSNWVEYGPGSNYHFVSQNGKHGLITNEGKVIIPVVYDSLFYQNDEVIILSKNNKYGVVTIQNKPVIPFVYDKIYTEFYMANNGKDELYVLRNGKYATIDINNNVIRDNVSKNEIIDKFN